MIASPLPKLLKPALVAAALVLGLATQASAADTYQLDGRHTSVTFQYTHFGYSHPTGKFSNAVGSVTLDDSAPEKSSVEVSFAIDGINTGVDSLDADLKSANFFDAAQFPTATFKSTKVEPTSATTAKVTGDLTLHGITRPLTLDVTLNKEGEHPMSHLKTAGFTAKGSLLRSDFGIGKLVPMVSDRIDLYIEAEAKVQ